VLVLWSFGIACTHTSGRATVAAFRALLLRRTADTVHRVMSWRRCCRATGLLADSITLRVVFSPSNRQYNDQPGMTREEVVMQGMPGMLGGPHGRDGLCAGSGTATTASMRVLEKSLCSMHLPWYVRGPLLVNVMGYLFSRTLESASFQVRKAKRVKERW
jgi:hypothetical protein